MKIEIGESLACSYLCHVRKCMLSQTNWKVSEHWERSLSDEDVETLFQKMKRRFERNGGVFKQTKDAAQFLKQGEIDVVGVDRHGGVHAMEVAFHEAGLNYGSTAETDDRVLKKMLRALLICRVYFPPSASLHVSFLSPKVNPAVQQPLEATFADLRSAYPKVDWRLFVNDVFVDDVVKPTLEKAGEVADSSEVFVRSAKLLKLAGVLNRDDLAFGRQRTSTTSTGRSDSFRKIQPLVRDLMHTLLVDFPALLSEAEKRELQDNEYCKSIGLRIGNPLIRRRELGREVKGHARYWKAVYGDFYVCSQWWAEYHTANAQALLAFVHELAKRKSEQSDVLHPHVHALRDYLTGECASPGRANREES